eukprot:3116003-Rhodomonas_salina.2
MVPDAPSLRPPLTGAGVVVTWITNRWPRDRAPQDHRRSRAPPSPPPPYLPNVQTLWKVALQGRGRVT